MSKFKVGDKVHCVEGGSGVEYGKTYVVTLVKRDNFPHLIQVSGAGETHTCFESRFKLVPPTPQFKTGDKVRRTLCLNAGRVWDPAAVYEVYGCVSPNGEYPDSLILHEFPGEKWTADYFELVPPVPVFSEGDRVRCIRGNGEDACIPIRVGEEYTVRLVGPAYIWLEGLTGTWDPTRFELIPADQVEFKVGDKVRRKAEWRGSFHWNRGDELLTVTEVLRCFSGKGANLKFAGADDTWDHDKFSLIERPVKPAAKTTEVPVTFRMFSPYKLVNLGRSPLYCGVDWGTPQLVPSVVAGEKPKNVWIDECHEVKPAAPSPTEEPGWRTVSPSEILKDGDQFWTSISGWCNIGTYVLGDRAGLSVSYRRRCGPMPASPSHPFKVGQRVRCVRSSGDLHQGEVYAVCELGRVNGVDGVRVSHSNSPFVIPNKGVDREFNMDWMVSRFEAVKTVLEGKYSITVDGCTHVVWAAEKPEVNAVLGIRTREV